MDIETINNLEYPEWSLCLFILCDWSISYTKISSITSVNKHIETSNF